MLWNCKKQCKFVSYCYDCQVGVYKRIDSVTGTMSCGTTVLEISSHFGDDAVALAPDNNDKNDDTAEDDEECPGHVNLQVDLQIDAGIYKGC